MIAELTRWDLAAETIAVKIRWFGILFGYLLVNLGDVRDHRLNLILALGVAYTIVDTAFSLRGLALATGEYLLACLAHNLGKLLRVCALPTARVARAAA